MARRGTRSLARDERELIQRAREGEATAFEQLFRLYHRRVLTLAFRSVGHEEDARDVAQEVFVRLYRHLPKYDPGRPFFTWFYRLIINSCRDHLRTRRRTDPIIPIDDVPESALGQTAATDEPWAEASQKVFELTHTLPLAQKTAFILRDVEGFSAGEIAEIMDCPPGTVRSHLHHARHRLRDLLRRRYPELVPGFDEERTRELS